MEPNNKLFQSDMETIEEFLERWKVHNYDVLSKLKTDGTDDTKKVMLLVRALSVEVTTDIQRKLQPTSLSDAKFEDVEKHL